MPKHTVTIPAVFLTARKVINDKLTVETSNTGQPPQSVQLCAPNTVDVPVKLQKQAGLENKKLFMVFSFRGSGLCRIFEARLTTIRQKRCATGILLLPILILTGSREEKKVMLHAVKSGYPHGRYLILRERLSRITVTR